MKKDKNLRWLATTKEATKTILNIVANNKGKDSLQLPDISVLLFIINNMDYDNKAKLPTQKEIGSEINLTPRRISMAIIKLRKLNFIAKLPEAKTYYINPFYFYIGDYRDLHHKYEVWKKLVPNSKTDDDSKQPSKKTINDINDVFSNSFNTDIFNTDTPNPFN